MKIFGKKKEIDKNSPTSQHYEETPINILFGNFILSTINRLPKEKNEQLNAMNLAKVFHTEPKDWRLVLKQVLHLSDTIEIAILDLWYENQEKALQRNVEYMPNQFVADFINSFLSTNSQIDAWDSNSLNRAKERIKRNQETKA
jgi:hypothetical protein